MNPQLGTILVYFTPATGWVSHLVTSKGWQLVGHFPTHQIAHMTALVAKVLLT